MSRPDVQDRRHTRRPDDCSTVRPPDRPALAYTPPARRWVTSDLAWDSAKCAAKTTPQSAASAEQVMIRPLGVCVREKPEEACPMLRAEAA